MSRLPLLATLALLFLPACRTLDATGGERWVRTELYFGLTRSGGVAISSDAWNSFLDTAITPRFPDGLTVLDGYGQYRSSAAAITREPMRLLVLLHHGGASEVESIARIRLLYRAAFQQESVLEVTNPVSASF